MIKKYFIFCYEGEALPIAWHLQREGCDVVLGIVHDAEDTISRVEKNTGQEDPSQKEKRLRLYDGIVAKTPAKELVEELKTIPDPENYFVFFEMNHLFAYAEKVKPLGFPGNYPTEEEYILEVDRQEARSFVAKHYTDISLLPAHAFKTIADAISFLQTDNNLWVLKGFDPEASVFIPTSTDTAVANEQIIAELKKQKALYERSGLLIEKYISNLAEYLPQRIYYDGTLLGVTVDIENKTMEPAGKGIQTGCAADLVFPIPFESKMNSVAFPAIVDEPAKQHEGLFFWDGSLLIDKDTDTIYFGEYCANRSGYNEFYTQLCQLPSVSYFFECVVKKKQPFTVGTMGASTRLFHLQYDADDPFLSNVVYDFEGEDKKHFWPMDAYDKDGKFASTNYDFNLAAVTGAGNSVTEAITQLENNLSKFTYKKAHYRPVSDFISRDYPSAIVNRLEYALTNNLFSLPEEIIEGIL